MAGRPNQPQDIFGGFQQLSWRPWRELSAMAMMLMELSWSVAWFQFLAAPELFLTLGRSFLFLGLWIASAYSLARGMHFLRLHANARRVAMLTVFLVGVLAFLKVYFYTDRSIKLGTILVTINDAFKSAALILPVEIIVIAFAGYLWNRGISLASVWIDVRHAAHHFRLGAMMLLLLGVCTSLRRVEGLTIGITLYLFSSLLAIGAARASTIELLRGGRTRPFDIRWLISLTVASTGVVVLAWFVGSIATTAFGDLVVATFYFLLRVLLILGLLIVSPIVLIMLLIFPLLESRLQTSPLFQEIQEQVRLVIERVAEILNEISSLLQGFWESLPVLPFVKPLVLWFIVGLLLLLVLRTASIPRRRSVFQEDTPDMPESISEAGGVGTYLRKMFVSNVGALTERLSMLRRGGRLFGALRVRVIYANLMRLCEEFGCPRRKVQTPLEFLPTLRGLFPDHFVEIELITDAYNRVRYGELPELRGDIQRVEDAWRRVREQAKNLRQAQEYLENKM